MQESEKGEIMPKNLVIVESPAKAKTIEKFLGKDFHVVSCFGHIRDLPKSHLSIDVKNGFKPDYEIQKEKKSLVAQLQKDVKAAECVWLASDEDREGEAIAWHLADVLKLEKNKMHRIVFNEITKSAILNAIEHPRELDYNLVDAQQARRVLDRLVGYEISPVLWRKVRPQLSAGRVQSVAVRLVVERENEIKHFKESSSFKVTASFGDFLAELSTRFKTEKETSDFLMACGVASFKIDGVEVKPAKRSPSAPFTTSTLQQEASRKLGFSVSKTMIVAQQLYEEGYITYMRTDSVNLSNLALSMASDMIKKTYGEKYVKTRKYDTKSKGAQEAHEAIRPTAMDRVSISGDAAQVRLYDLIWKRTIASQMAEAETEKTTVYISVSERSENFVARGEVLLFEGFLKVYSESKDDEVEDADGSSSLLPPMKKGQMLTLKRVGAREVFTQRPSRYSEAMLVKKLEELGIGRPSTYAPTITTITKREYVIKEDRPGVVRDYIAIEGKGKGVERKVLHENTGADKMKLFPTDIGILVTQFLMDNFSDILDYNFTAEVEKRFDEVAQGLEKWTEMLSDFYSPFHEQVLATTKNSEKVSGERLLGVDPQSGVNIYVKLSRFGPCAQKGETNTEVKPVFASLKKGQTLETVTLEDALELFKLPRNIGTFEDEDMVVAVGRFGPYIRHKGSFYSIPKTEDPITISADMAVEIIEAKRKTDLEKTIKVFDEAEPIIYVLNGRFGPYISCDKKNYKIDKKQEAAKLTLQDCKAIIDAAPASSSKGRFSKTKSSTTLKASSSTATKAKRTTTAKTKNSTTTKAKSKK